MVIVNNVYFVKLLLFNRLSLNIEGCGGGRKTALSAHCDDGSKMPAFVMDTKMCEL